MTSWAHQTSQDQRNLCLTAWQRSVRGCWGGAGLCLPTGGTSSPELKPLPLSACIIHLRAWAL